MNPTEQLLREIKEICDRNANEYRDVVVSRADLAKLIQIVEVLRDGIKFYSSGKHAISEANDGGVARSTLAKADAIAKGSE